MTDRNRKNIEVGDRVRVLPSEVGRSFNGVVIALDKSYTPPIYRIKDEESPRWAGWFQAGEFRKIGGAS